MLTNKMKVYGKANDAAIVKGDKYRFTILTPRLIRIEYNENGYFEDQATQAVISRQFDVPKFSVKDTGDKITIDTGVVLIEYTKEPFSENSLTVKTMENGVDFCTWRYTERYAKKYDINLKGTVRTLDGVDGACELENGIMSKNAKPILMDDSNSLVIKENGDIEPRQEVYKDQYLFCYGILPANFDYNMALKDFHKLTGNTPLIPRYTLGNWWSRYHEYTQDEYLELMDKFRAEDIPFSVSVIDMDWHLTKINPKYGSGWTGYSWNKELFPDHKAFLSKLHEMGLMVTINVHPDGGIAPHEDKYKEMAEAMGIDPDSEVRIPFDIADPKFVENYFKIIHHPMEDEGVDFWWIDWQQGTVSAVKGLDPLWMLNHLHYLDNERKGKRPLILSRYSGAGAHRYPIGFSGDTIMSWDSLDFQPYFTANASNIGYSWWSHDIGGHMWGNHDDELSARWVQFGVFSPINRLHSSNNPFTSKEPWNYEKNAELAMKKFLKLRHQLVPYLYSMNYRSHMYSEPLIKPMYYTWNSRESFLHKNEYTFGTEMIVSPITRPHNEDTNIGCSDTYLPEGMWYDFFTNDRYMGNRTLKTHRSIYNMPVFVKAGGIVPMSETDGVDNPKDMRIKVYMGANGEFDLYEDDGITTDYQNGKYAITKMQLIYGEKPEFEILAPSGDESVIPTKRNYAVEFIGLSENLDVSVTVNGEKCDFEADYTDGVVTVKVENVCGNINISFEKNVELKANDTRARVFELINVSGIAHVLKWDIYNIITEADSVLDALVDIYAKEDLGENMKSAISEILTAECYGKSTSNS